ncbi:hypothetical protein Kisp02_68200 [Kineosporia sp. NBRC 101731]|nr:hypothetical protein Kisp02_68200 [Kineosporia sp. NBRC 101731]
MIGHADSRVLPAPSGATKRPTMREISTATGAAELNAHPSKAKAEPEPEPGSRASGRSGSPPVLTAQELHRELRTRGLQIAAVTGGADRPDQLTVYLHGTAGQWLHGRAHQVIAQVPGVVVLPATSCPTILAVWTGINLQSLIRALMARARAQQLEEPGAPAVADRLAPAHAPP